MAVPLVVAAATANPTGLIIGGAVKAYGEESGSATIEGSAHEPLRKSPTGCASRSRTRAGI